MRNLQERMRTLWGISFTHDATAILVHTVLGYQRSKMWFELGNNADNPHADAEMEMVEQQMDDAILNYILQDPERVRRARKVFADYELLHAEENKL
jgi:hypothetical protein